MPPKPKYSKDEIVETAFQLVREKGADALTARELADRLSTSSRPIFTAFENMTELKLAVLKKCQALFEAYVSDERGSGRYPEYKAMGMAYIKLAKQEKNIFKLLYMRDTTGETELSDSSFSKATDEVQRMLSVDYTVAEKLHFEVWTWVHGIASMLATSYLDLDFELISDMLTDVYQALKERLLNERDN